jgi:lipopolysaccharide export system permease protein
MMNIAILDKYIGRQIIAIILVVALALLGLDLFFTLVNELKVVGRGHYTLSTMFSFLGLTAPSRIYAMFPWSALLGTLIGMGVLANHRELVVMRTASISVMRICYSVVKAALLLIIVIVFLGEAVAPFADNLAQRKKSMALSSGQSIDTSYGLWVRHEHEFFHVRIVRAQGELVGITRYQFDSNLKLKEVSFAESAIKEESGWRLFNIKSTQFIENKTQVLQLKEQLIKTLLDPEILETATMKHPERLSLAALWRVIKHRSKNELNSNMYELAFWTKVFQPFLILLMVILAVPFVFGPLRSVSMGFRIVAGIIVAYSFHTLNGLMGPLALVYQAPPIIAILAPISIFAGLGYWLLRRVS